MNIEEQLDGMMLMLNYLQDEISDIKAALLYLESAEKNDDNSLPSSQEPSDRPD